MEVGKIRRRIMAMFFVVWVITATGQTAFLEAANGSYASNPDPADGALIVGDIVSGNISTALVFVPGATAVEHTGYFSDDYSKVESRAQDANLGPPPYGEFVGYEYTFWVGNPGVPPADESLVRGVTYYWCVDETDALGTTYPGDIWEFNVQDYKACCPNPPDGAVVSGPDVLLSWKPGYGAEEHDIYMGTSWEDVNNAEYDPFTPPPEFLATRPEPNILVTGLSDNTTYYCRVDEIIGRAPPYYFPAEFYKGDVWSFKTGGTFSGSGSGTAGDPYIITNVNQLQEMQYDLDAYYELGNDIDASDTVNWNAGAGFLQVGPDTGDPNDSFTGKFDGRGHVITGLYINRPSTGSVGLFGYIYQAEITNVGLINADVTALGGAGTLVGSSEASTITNSWASGSVTGTHSIQSPLGGLIGWTGGVGGFVSQCHSSVNVFAVSSGSPANRTGGLVGTNSRGSIIEDCYATGNVSAKNKVGGLVGDNLHGSQGGYVARCYSTGLVTGSGGGLIGYNYDGGITYDSYWDTQTSGKTTSYGGTPKPTSEMKKQATFVGWDFVNTWDIEENVTYPFLRGTGVGTGPIAHWKFDEGSGTVAYDSAGNNDGTLVNGPIWTTGIIDGALDFDGVDDYVEVPYTEDFQVSVLTFAGWICPTQDLASRGVGIITRGEDAVTDRSHFGLCVRSTSSPWGHGVGVGYETDNDDDYTYGTDWYPPVGEWTHIAATRAGDGLLIIYANGVVIGQWDSTPIPASNCYQDLIIGANRDGQTEGGFFPGQIDDVRIYERALSASEVMELYAPGAGPVAHWKFDEGTGSVAYDSAGTNDGTLVNGPIWTTGIIDGALDFDGVDDYVKVNNGPSLGFSQYDSFSICHWVKPLSLIGDDSVVSKFRTGGQSGVFGYRTGWRADTSAFRFVVEKSFVGWTEVDTTGSSADGGSWYHVTAVYDNKDMKIYLDGKLINSGTFSYDTGSTIPDSDLTIGARAVDSQIDKYFDGTIDDVRIYDRALSAVEIEELYNSVPVPPVGKTYHVDGVNGDNTNDGLTKETAFKTIQRGINVAEDFDTVLVWPGVYNEEVSFWGNAITVKSAADAAIVETDYGYAFSFFSAEGRDTVLSNFVIRNSQYGIYLINGASPTLRNLTIVDNDFGISAFNGADPDISSCIFWNNYYGDLFRDPLPLEAKYSWVQDEVNEPIAHWKLDEGTGSVAYDSAGTNDGTIYGAQWISGQIGGALDFDGVDDYISIPHNTTLNITGDITISVWIYLNEGAVLEAIVTKCVGNGSRNNPYDFRTKRSVLTLVRADAIGHEFVYSDVKIPLGEWHHGLVRVENKVPDFYVDGVITGKTDSVIFTKTPTGNTEPVLIGRRDDGLYFNGLIDDVRIYERALSAGEIEAIYGAGLAGISYGEPGFVNAAGGDYHLLSERGRYWPAHDVWVLDDATSPCIDGGDPAVDPSNERMPNGGRINMGAYGNSAYASMSECWSKSDFNCDGAVDFKDFAIMAAGWLDKAAWIE